jgi:diaminohydroxyphosphoribosylaminopyrimidine deaminase/5-amino-6-(5-phosphoribosylamino)uracil reductase
MNDTQFMQRAIELARKGEGFVEPNPMVGCVLVKDGEIVGEGYHKQFGGNHAEVEALNAAGKNARGAACYVTLEPCNHHGKTPPCTEALINAGITRVVVAMRDSNPLVFGKGIKRLLQEGIEVVEGILESEAMVLNAPYFTYWQKHRPWVIAKWAMTLDGRIASWTGDSQWISGEASRKAVHQLRGRMDAIMVGSQTAIKDDSSLTVRYSNPNPDVADTVYRRVTDPTIPRVPLRIVMDSFARVPMESRLVRTAKDIPVLIVTNPDAPAEKVDALRQAGCEILRLPWRIPSETVPLYLRERDQRTKNETDEQGKIRLGQPTAVETVYRERVSAFLFEHLATRQVMNLLVEGGSYLFGTLFDLKLIDEVHVFIAPKLIGGKAAVPVFGGVGLPEMEFASRLKNPVIDIIEEDVYVHGRLR